MNIEQLYRDYNIPYSTEGHKHCRPGWVNTECPFCTGNPGLHLGYDTNGNKFVCWRCGGHYPNITIAKLLNITVYEANKVIKQYDGIVLNKKPNQPKKRPKLKAFKYPSNVVELQKNHSNYLIKRNFDPEKIQKEWNIMGTGVIAKLDELNYKHRIIIPYMWDDKIVSFDSRDITGKAMNKYQACPLEREIISHKHILYGKQEAWKDTGICVEGTTDVWRLGKYAWATSGIKYTAFQLRIISKTFKRVFVLFDEDKQAQYQADKLVSDLRYRGIDAIKLDIIGDPGSMKQDDADYLVRQLIK
jgi:hypothetical protein